MRIATFILFPLLSVFPHTQTEPISFSNLKPYQHIKVEWRYRACFSSYNYDLDVRGEPHFQIEAMNYAEIAIHNHGDYKIRIAESELRDWDKMLADYRAEKKSKCGVSEESLTISLYDSFSGDGILISQEVFQNKCASSKLWNFVNPSNGFLPQRSSAIIRRD